jgi:hypothetical protein
MRPSALLSVLLAGAAPACSDPNPLPPATVENRIDTLTVYALSGTEVWLPSAYSGLERRVLRLDQSNNADLVYERTPSGRRAFLPSAVVGLPGLAGIDPGLRRSSIPFDSITIAEVDSYVTLDTVDVAVGDVFFLRSRISPLCSLGLPTYGKIEILSFDDAPRTAQFRALVNNNCGYRGLEPGLPKQ